MIKVYGFPRSGAHYLMALLADNFYPDADLHTPGGEVGHWANRAIVGAVQHGKLAGHHGPPDWGVERPAIYIYRDGRAVAASLYRSAHFHHPTIDSDNVPFPSYLRIPLDWRWSPGHAASPIGPNVIEHWVQHLQAWEEEPVLKLRYEWIVAEPTRYLGCIANVFELEPPQEWVLPEQLVGHFPSGGALAGWRELWGDEDEAWFREQVPKGFYGVYTDES